MKKASPPAKGFLTFTLHAHLPYVVNHGTWPHGMEWLHEAAAETYLPLLRMLTGLERDGIRFQCNLNLSPILLEQLAHPVFIAEFPKYLVRKVVAAREDEAFFMQSGEVHYAETARFWYRFFTQALDDFEGCGGNIISRFRHFDETGLIDIITCGATHGYMPLLGTDESVRAQVRTAVDTHIRHIGRAPKGIWAPECGYRPAGFWDYPVPFAGGDPTPAGFDRIGVEQAISESGIEFFFVDTHLVEDSVRVPSPYERLDGAAAEDSASGKSDSRYLYQPYYVDGVYGSLAGGPYGADGGVHGGADEALHGGAGGALKTGPIKTGPIKTEPVKTGSLNVGAHERSKGGLDDGAFAATVFPRDPRTGMQVWSGDAGYPGDGSYLDFHKKRWPGGHRYWRVTGAKVDMGSKQPYYPQHAAERVKAHATHYTQLVWEALQPGFGRPTPPILCSPFDAELFGHWWFEGILWLEAVARNLHDHDTGIQLISCVEYLEKFPRGGTITMHEGSWGVGGANQVWMNPETSWTYTHIYPAEIYTREVATAGAWRTSAEGTRLVKQLCRELLLLESSDWQFLITTGAARDYAEIRFFTHNDQFNEVKIMWQSYEARGVLSAEQAARLAEIELRDGVFPGIEPGYWAMGAQQQRVEAESYTAAALAPANA